MTQTVIDMIGNLADEFTPNPFPSLGGSVKLDDPFLHAFNLLRHVDEDKTDEAIWWAFRFCREERHYSLNITTLLYYFLYYLNNYRDYERVQWDFRSRLTLDVEQLVTNTRSLRLNLPARNEQPMPEIFYCSKYARNGIRPLYLRKFVVYVAAPVIALELVLGRYLGELVKERYGPTPSYDVGCPYNFNSNIQALHNLIIQNKECLDATIYRSTYFTRSGVES